MKIGVYSDLHCCRTTSIMPLHSKGIYTCRLDMNVKTLQWAYKTFDEEKVDLVLNTGDTFNSNSITSDELTAISEGMSYSTGIDEIIIPGNHEILDINGLFGACNIFKKKNIRVIMKPTKIDNIISVIPYCRTEDITKDILTAIQNKIVFTHIDIKGSKLRPDYILPTGIEAELLAYFFELTINGHLHTPEVLETSVNKVCNIGSVSSISFSDNQNYIPSICIIDTDTLNIKRIENPHSILFRKFSVSSVFDLSQKLERLDKRYSFILKVSCPFKIRTDVKDILQAAQNIVSSKVLVEGTNDGVEIKKIVQKTDCSVKEEFSKFLYTSKDLKYPIEEYQKILNEVN